MKEMMKFAIMALIAIVVVSAFGIQLMPVAPVSVPETFVGQELYVCPAASSGWDGFATVLTQFMPIIKLAFMFVVMLLLFLWGWELYQNLLKDKFIKDAYSKPWQFTKLVFWAGVIVAILALTPNHYRGIKIAGAPGDWVLCENNSPDARAVMADAVSR